MSKSHWAFEQVVSLQPSDDQFFQEESCTSNHCRLRKPVEASPVPLVADENGMVPLEESWKPTEKLGKFQGRVTQPGNLGVLIVALWKMGHLFWDTRRHVNGLIYMLDTYATATVYIINTQKSYQTKHIKQAELVQGESSRNWRVRLSMAQQVFLEVSSSSCSKWCIVSWQTRDSNKQKACQTAVYCRHLLKSLTFIWGWGCPYKTTLARKEMELRRYFRSRRSRGAFQKRCRQKVLSIEGSAVVFIGIGSHISSLRWICRKNPQHRASVVSTKQIEDTFIREKPIWERPSYMESCFGERTRRTLQGGRVSMEDLFDWMQEETTPLALRVKVAWYVWSLRQVELDDRKRQKFLKHALQLQPYWLKFEKRKKIRCWVFSIWEWPKRIGDRQKTRSVFDPIFDPKILATSIFKRFTFLHRGW